MDTFIDQMFKKYIKSTWFHSRYFIENSKFLLNSCLTQYPNLFLYGLCLLLNEVFEAAGLKIVRCGPTILSKSCYEIVFFSPTKFWLG
jgi:hypothetical protein